MTDTARSRPDPSRSPPDPSPSRPDPRRARPDPDRPPRVHWRDYQSASGRKPVEEFIDSLPERDAVSVLRAMDDVRTRGLPAARHVRGSIWEVRSASSQRAYRVLFAQEGSRGRILLALEAFEKKTQKTPHRTIELAQRRLSDWRRRGATGRPAPARDSLDR